jgi:alpha-L-fucosidase
MLSICLLASITPSATGIYVYDWNAGKITVPALPGNSIRKAGYLNTTGVVKFIKTKEGCEFTAPVSPDEIATIIELDMNNPVTAVSPQTGNSLFAGPEYGRLIKSGEIMTGNIKKGLHMIDLKEIFNVTGIGIYDSKTRIKVNMSADGKNWTEAGTVNKEPGEISVTTYTTGAEVLGRRIRYLQFHAEGGFTKTKIKVYAR